MARQAGRIAALAVVLLTCGAAAADAPVQALAGRYSSHFRNGSIDGTRYWSDDVVEVVPVDPRHAYVRFDLQFFNGHSCSLSGIAASRGDSLVYVEPAAAANDGLRCTLTVRRNGDKLTWSDGDGSCKSYCGARGSLLDDDLPWRSKRPIRYLPKLKASNEYRTALTEWRTGKTARD